MALTSSRVAAGLGPIKVAGPLKIICRGMESEPMPSFSEAIQDVASAGYIQDVMEASDIIYEQAKDAKTFGDLKGDPVPVDGVASIMKYSAESTCPPFYSDMNAKCYLQDRSKTKPYAKFLWLFHASLKCIEVFPGHVVFRGVKADLKDQYPMGRQVTWHGITSCTTDIGVLSNDMFLGKIGKRTIFNIELTQNQAREITRYSLIPSEREVVIPAGSRLEVVGVLDQGDLTMISLKELPSKEWLMDIAPAIPAATTSAPKPQNLDGTWTLVALTDKRYGFDNTLIHVSGSVATFEGGITMQIAPGGKPGEFQLSGGGRREPFHGTLDGNTVTWTLGTEVIQWRHN